MADAPTLDDLKAWLGLAPEDETDDAMLQQSLDASVVAQGRVCALPTDQFGAPTYDEDLVEALLLRSQRLAARRNSPEGVVGLSGTGGDFTAARVPSYDADIDSLEGPFRKIAVA